LGVAVHDKMKGVRTIRDSKVIESGCTFPLRPGMIGAQYPYLSPVPDKPCRFDTGWRFEYSADSNRLKKPSVVQLTLLYLPVILITALIFPIIFISSVLPSMTTGL